MAGPPRRSMAQAIAIAVRPTYGVILAWQALRQRWLAVAWTVAAGCVIALAALPFVGVQGYLDYLSVLQNLSDVLGATGNRSLGTTFGSEAALFAGYVVAGCAVLLSLRRDREAGFVVAAGASMLLSPLLWGHYLRATRTAGGVPRQPWTAMGHRAAAPHMGSCTTSAVSRAGGCPPTACAHAVLDLDGLAHGQGQDAPDRAARHHGL